MPKLYSLPQSHGKLPAETTNSTLVARLTVTGSPTSHGRVYAEAVVNAQSAMALLDTAGTLCLLSEGFADQCISKACHQPADPEATSASNPGLNLIGNARVPILVGGKKTLKVIYIDRRFFHDDLFGMDFMNVARATLQFRSHTQLIKDVLIPTKVGKLKASAHSMCDLFSSKAFMLLPRTSRAVKFNITPLGDAHVKDDSNPSARLVTNLMMS